MRLHWQESSLACSTATRLLWLEPGYNEAVGQREDQQQQALQPQVFVLEAERAGGSARLRKNGGARNVTDELFAAPLIQQVDDAILLLTERCLALTSAVFPPLA